MVDAISGLLLFFIILLLINPLVKLLRWIWELSVTLCKTNPVDLKEKFGEWAVVTGSTDGVGKEYAKELAKRNVNIVLISRTLEKLKKVKTEIEILNPNVQVKIIQADFSIGKAEIDKIEAQLADIPIGILVNNVGKITEYPMYFGEISKNELWETININITAATLMTRLVIDQMKRNGKGAIVNVSSATDLVPSPLLSVYSASKIYIRYLSEAVRAEYSKYGITVQCLSPFYINTKMVGYSERIQNHELLCPDATLYAKNAIETLGKLDSTTGYWPHEIEHYLMTLCPVWLRIKIVFLINRLGRRDYLALQKKKTDE
ncbi:hydroxysteroid dehydrogenase-like protein 1 [Phymastichus coffea]|uniref:hydroxysteroid dehydrogenase-like protein 1 n=1 Tax=Phymastichus coffea TaxID=108790 RepID=UPI00273B18CB|nr:hydroxysteroid dehydrogenase-like protein 1 [Phymastichus coffea]XP_058802268.1 hydroxysteroid dehydrogenase-like protein 1 [Phymastichus coffea]XP_058802269.1 hydroxysteroid dehydrogenase-like protein 1 [Phymastichus coffea]XP_058802270.1 hydroxysteroid dehydrogenase-like protein 1 [Phymastichus coffea]